MSNWSYDACKALASLAVLLVDFPNQADEFAVLGFVAGLADIAEGTPVGSWRVEPVARVRQNLARCPLFHPPNQLILRQDEREAGLPPMTDEELRPPRVS